MFGSLDISTSGMVAQRTRLTAISANIANRNSVYADGTPYQGRQVVLTPGNPGAAGRAGQRLGVHVSEVLVDESPFNLRWDPGDPLAMQSGPHAGYVRESNVNIINEQVNALQASRAYEANAVAAEATKVMLGQALRLLG